MSLESIHIIYKNLVSVGKEMDVDKFRRFFIERGFSQGERVIPTPAGPLKEFLLRDPKTMRDLVVCSVKGFVVDARDKENAKRLMDLAYDAFEIVYGESFQTLILNIQVISNIIMFVKDGMRGLLSAVDKGKLDKLRKLLKAQNLHVRTIGVRWGSRSSKQGETSVVISPLIAPDGRVVKDRFTITIEYFGNDSDEGILFVDKLEELAKKVALLLLR